MNKQTILTIIMACFVFGSLTLAIIDIVKQYHFIMPFFVIAMLISCIILATVIDKTKVNEQSENNKWQK